LNQLITEEINKNNTNREYFTKKKGVIEKIIDITNDKEGCKVKLKSFEENCEVNKTNISLEIKKEVIM